MNLDLHFSGELADAHLLPAVEGTQSLEGIARSVTLICHYVVTGRVRYRAPFADDFGFVLEAFEPGSFLTRFRLTVGSGKTATWMAAAGVVAAQGVLGNFTYDIIKTTFNAAVGTPTEPGTPEVAHLLERRPGDVDALREAVKPALRRGHAVVGNGANSITIVGDGNKVVIMNQATKEFLEQQPFQNTPEVKVVSVGMLNANSRYGRAFDRELGRTVPFFVARDCAARKPGEVRPWATR